MSNGGKETHAYKKCTFFTCVHVMQAYKIYIYIQSIFFILRVVIWRSGEPRETQAMHDDRKKWKFKIDTR